MPDARTARRINRAHWDALAAAHGQDAYYDTEALIAGRDSLTEVEAAGIREAIGAVAGLDVLHLQCHIGFDAISLARRGARVVGVDFSPASLEKAQALARRCEVDVRFVEAEATSLPAELHNRFDLVYATIGVLVWIADLRAWMRSAAAALRGGGRLLLADLPVASTATVNYAHSVGEVVNAALAAGLRIEHLEEHVEADFDPRASLLPRDDDGRVRLRVDGELLPFLFTLVAAKP
jgi:SAM-dependent methyltransferase